MRRAAFSREDSAPRRAGGRAALALGLPLALGLALVPGGGSGRAQTVPPAATGPVPAPGATATRPGAGPVPARPAAPPDPVAGLALYQERCASCHGPLGRGDGETLADLPGRLPGRPPSFADPAYARGVTPAGHFEAVSEGRIALGMPPWKGALSEAERWDALAGAWSFYFTPERLVRGRAAWEAACAGCHGADGRGGAAVPLADPGYLATRSQADLANATRLAAAAHPDLAAVSDEALWSALDHARSFGWRLPGLAGLAPGGRIAGRVVNGTAGGGEVAGASVRLVPVGALMPGAPMTRTVAADGAFAFEDLIAGPEARYALVARYGGIEFFAPELLDLSREAPERPDLSLAVHEAASDVPVTMRTGHLIVSPDPEAGLLRVAEVWVVANETDRALVAPEGGATLRFPLPANVGEIRLDDSRMRAADRMEGDTLVDTVPVPPGERQVVISYDLPYDGTSAELSRVLPLDTAELRVLATGEGVTVASPSLPEQASRDMQGQVVREAAGRDLAAGAELAISFGGLPESSGAAAANLTRPLPPPPVGQEALAMLGLLLGALGLGVALYFPRLAGRGGAVAERRAADRARLVGQIAALDRAYAAGGLPVERYRRERAALVDRALALARAQAEGERMA